MCSSKLGFKPAESILKDVQSLEQAVRYTDISEAETIDFGRFKDMTRLEMRNLRGRWKGINRTSRLGKMIR